MLYVLDSHILNSKRMPSMACEHCGSKETVHLHQYLSYLSILGLPITSTGTELASECTNCESVLTEKEFSGSFKLAVENFDFKYKYPFKFHLIYFVIWFFWLTYITKVFGGEAVIIDNFFWGSLVGLAVFIISYLLLENVNQNPNFLFLYFFIWIGPVIFWILLFYFYYDKHSVKPRAKSILYNKAIYFIHQNIEAKTKVVQKEVEVIPTPPISVKNVDLKFIAEMGIINMVWYLRKNGFDPNDFNLSNVRHTYPMLAFEINRCYEKGCLDLLEDLEESLKTRNNILTEKFAVKEKFRIATMVAKLHNQVLWNKDININIVTELLSSLHISPKNTQEYWEGLITKNGEDLLSFVFTETDNDL